MGAQQMKASTSQLQLSASKQHYLPSKRNTNDIHFQQAKTLLETVLPNQSRNSIFPPKQRITVANFAKIKMEPPESVSTVDDSTQVEPLNKKLKIEEHNIFDKSEDTLDAEDAICVQDLAYNCVELKKELIEANVEDSVKIISQNDGFSCMISNARSSNAIQCTDDFLFITDSQSKVDDKRQVSRLYEKVQGSKNIEEVIGNTNQANKTKLVRNPFALLKSCDKVPNQKECLNTTLNSEPVILEKEVDISNPAALKKSCLNVTLKTEPIILDDEVETLGVSVPTIAQNELIIKSEDLRVNETIQETDKSTSLYQKFFSFDLNSSLDVNLSEGNADFEESSSKKSIVDVTESKYFSTIEISSVEEEGQNLLLNKNIKTQTKRKPFKKNACCGYRLRKKFNFRKKNQRKTRLENKTAAKPKTKPYKTKKYAEKDSVYKIGIKKNTILKNLPKRAIKTRKKATNSNVKKAKISAELEFPKPFKLETAPTNKENRVAVELPKPIKVDREFTLNTKYKKSYLTAEYQPCVRLKRLESDELLVPLRTKHGRRTRKFQSTRNNRRDFLIQQAYSLHPYIKLNRLSIDQDHSYCNEHRSLSSHLAMSNNVLTEMENESLSEKESKYFSTRERFSLFQSSTPDGSSMLSGPIDSGFSTSTPSTSRRSLNCNKTLLLEIAAERAFINNHLMHFGYSPMQFELFNNFKELTVFLKYLFGSLSKN